MPEPITLASTRSTQTLKLIETDPLNPTSWEELVAKVRGQNDPLSLKSLEIIIEGLRIVQEMAMQAEKRHEAAPRVSSLSQGMFVRLARAYNSPTLLKEVGLIYLRELGLPKVALQHFERSLRLGGPEKELLPLGAAAAVAVQRQLTQVSGQSAHSGITTAQHAKPVALTIIRKTGKLLMPPLGAPKLSASGSEKAAPGQPLPATTGECLAEAESAIRGGQLTWAEQLLQKANQQPASHSVMWQAWTNLGQAAYDVGYPPLMETAFLEAVRYAPNELASQFNLALGLHLNDKYEAALVAYHKANKINPKHAKVWCNLGVLYFQMDQYAKAEEALRTSTVINPQYARAWDNLAAALGAQDKLDEALVACQSAVGLRPDYPEAYFKMGVIYFTRNELTLAATEFQRAILLPNLAAYCHCFLAMIHARLEQTDAAEAAVKRAASTDPKCDMLWMAWNDLGLLLYTSGQYQRAAVAYGEATLIKPDAPEAWFNLGISYHQSGDLKAARNAYQQAVDLRGTLAGAWHNLGIVCAQTDDYEAALTAFRREVHWDPANVRAWYDLGVTLAHLGRMEESRIAFARVDGLNHVAQLPSSLPALKDQPTV